MVNVRTIIYSAIAIMLVFTLMNSSQMYTFDSVTEFDSCSQGGGIIPCADCNTTVEDSTGWELYHENCASLIDTQNNTHCIECTDWGFRNTSRGLMILLFVLSMIATGFLFFKWRK